MIAINIPKRQITFKAGLTDRQKYKAVKNIWYNNNFLMCYQFPRFNTDYEGDLIPIPDRIYFTQDYFYLNQPIWWCGGL